jgi:SAM-dependent methyltransferase
MNESAFDALTSPTLTHLREYWWNDEFTAFIRDTLRPRPGNRILDVGCGEGMAELSIGRLHLSQIRQFGVDRLLDRVVVARYETQSHNQRVGFAAADAGCLPFVSAVFDSTYCVAVLQHVGALTEAVGEFARVTRLGGRVVIVEPDNAARYWFSSVASGAEVYRARNQFFTALAEGDGDHGHSNVGAQVPTLMAQHGIEPLSIRVFPVAQMRIGTAQRGMWADRTRRVERLVSTAPTEASRAAGLAYLEALSQYASEAEKAGQSFVEIQNTLLLATVGQRTE